MAKKILIIAIILLVIIVGVLVVYNLFFKEETSPPQGTNLPSNGGGELPTKKIIPLTDEAIIGPTLTADGQNIKYYLKENGHVYQVSLDGSKTRQISLTPLKNLIKAVWSPRGDKVITIFRDDEGVVTKYLYDYNIKQATLYDRYIQYIAWSPQGDKIAYHYFNEFLETNNISLANPNGSNWQNIFNTRMEDLIVNWAPNKISLHQRPSGLVANNLYILNPGTGDFHKIIDKEYGLDVKWSPDGDKVLYSATSQQGTNIGLYLVDGQGENKKDLGIDTLAEKCVWSQDQRTVYCAVPKKIPSRDILPDDYYKGTFTSSDVFWKINTELDEKTLLSYPSETEGGYDATNLLLSPREDKLFFVNRRDGRLYSIVLE